MKEYTLTLAIFVTLSGCLGGSSGTKGYSDLSAQEFKVLVDDPNTFVLDVHIPEQSHINGTDAFIPYTNIKENAGLLPENRSTPIAVYCRSGSMSVKASEDLVELGYANVYNLKGGVSAWKSAGYEV